MRVFKCCFIYFANLHKFLNPPQLLVLFYSHPYKKRSMRPRILGIIETWHLEKPCRMNTENIAPCFCIQSSTHRALRHERIQNIKKLFGILTLKSFRMNFSVYLKPFLASLFSLFFQIDHYLLRNESTNLLKKSLN